VGVDPESDADAYLTRLFSVCPLVVAVCSPQPLLAVARAPSRATCLALPAYQIERLIDNALLEGEARRLLRWSLRPVVHPSGPEHTARSG
jgi:hypothetical protein